MNILSRLYKQCLDSWRFGQVFVVFGLIVLFASACKRDESPGLVVTEVVVVEGADQVVTRVVRQTVAVTVTPNSAAPAPKYEPVVLDLSLTGRTPDIDPQKTGDPAGIDLIENIYVGLTNFNHETSTVEPELASSWQVTDGGRVWTFRLREDMFWVRPLEAGPADDGTWPVEPVRPLTAADVVYAIQRACSRETGAPDAFLLYLVEGCEEVYETFNSEDVDLETINARALNDFTLQVTLKEPASQFLTITSMWLLHPLPREVIEAEGEEWQTTEQLITSGPFIVSPGSIAAERPVLYRNPLWPLARKGNVDVVNMVPLNDSMQAYQLWQAKRLDVSPLPAAARSEALSTAPLKVHLVSDQTVFYLGFNFQSGVVREPEVRRALNAAIDRERLAEELFGGRAMGMRHLVPPGVVAAAPIDEVGRGYDPDYARQQMASSGFRNCRLMPPITYLVTTSDLSLQQAELIRQMWVEELDCAEEQIVIEQVQFGTLLANTRPDAGGLRPDIWELGWSSYYPDAENWLGELLHCEDSENRQGRPCSEVDDLIKQAVREIQPDRRQALYRQIENAFFGESGIEPLAPLYVSGDYRLIQSWLAYTPAIFGGEQYDTYVIEATLKRLEQSR